MQGHLQNTRAGAGTVRRGLILRKYLSIADIPRATAFRDIEDLVQNGLLVEEGTGRGTRYNLALPGWEWQPPGNENRGLIAN